MRAGTKVKTAVRVRPVMFNTEKQNSTQPGFESNLQIMTSKDEVRCVDVNQGNANMNFRYDRTFTVGAN
jgi:hypothetical protein